MKKAKSARPRSSSSADTAASPSNPVCSVETSLGDQFPNGMSSTDTPPEPQANKKRAHASQTAQSKSQLDFSDIPKDALPPERPDPILSLQLSAALHSRLRHQAQDEGISVEALALEMLAESVVLRAWEIVERKSAMRGLSNGPGGGQAQGSYNRGGYGNQSQANGNTKHPRPQYGASAGQNQHSNGQRAQGYNGGHGRHQNNAWMEDKAAFLEYVRNQEKRGRR
jgi:hypothetical protein